MPVLVSLQEHLNSLPPVSVGQAFAAEVLAGLATHALYKRYEFHPSNVPPTFALLVVLPILSSAFLTQHFSLSASLLLGGALFYATTLTSIVLYRLSPWHPLARYPGPFLAKITQFWLVRSIVSGRYHEILKELHDTYGPYVRVAPNEVSFVDVNLIPRVLGSDGMPKGPMFDGARVPGVPANIVATRSLEEHSQLRKPWTHALSSASLKDYAPTIKRRALQLADALEGIAMKQAGESATEREEGEDLAKWMQWFAFDFMGDMAFGGAFELMKEGDVTGIFSMINEQMLAQATLQRLPWITRVVHKFPAVVQAMRRFGIFCRECIERRRARDPIARDLFYHLVNEESGPNAFPDLDLVVESTKVIVVAGSDTTATTLSGVFYYLMRYPEVMKRLRKELDEAFPPGEGEPFDYTKLAELTFLNAVINETLRLQPPVPTDLQRAPFVGTEFKQIGDHLIKEGTAVDIPPYVFHRDPRYFYPLPDSFWPDRWLQPNSTEKQQQQFVLNTAAFIPFSFGPAGCVGKQLALMEVRSVTALLLQKFDVRFTEGYDPLRWEKEMKNLFVFQVGELPVVFTPRKTA